MIVPVISLCEFVMFPNIVLHFDVSKKDSLAAVQEAMDSNQKIFLVTKKDANKENYSEDNLYSLGVLANIKQVLKQDKASVRILVEGVSRAQAVRFIKEEKVLRAEILTLLPAESEQDNFDEALIRKARDAFAEYIALTSREAASDIIFDVMLYDDIGGTADYILANVSLKTEVKQSLLEETDALARLQKVLVILSKENEILKYKIQIGLKLKGSLDKSQKDFLLREQMKLLSQELGEDLDPNAEAKQFIEKLEKLNLSEEVTEKLMKECKVFSGASASSPDANIQRSYLEFALGLPWNKSSKENINISKARKVLDSEHFGLQDVKKRIIEFLSVRKLSSDVKGQIICLSGPPGVGKTSIVKSLAKAINRKYVRISLGGVNDESEIRGHRKTYIGAMPGRIMSAISEAKTNNPLILLDEIDKLSSDYKGDPASALLEVLDPEQNCAFHDRYLDVPFDLSKVMFIVTANDKNLIPEPLYDRMEIIDLYSYTYEEKFNIAKQHLIPKQLGRHGLTKRNFSITDDALRKLIECYTKEAGVRELERKISSLMRKAATDIVSGEAKSMAIDEENLIDILGPEKYKKDIAERQNEIGLVNGLAWTSVGGELLPIEVALMEGKGELQLTGSLGDVMKESAQIALSFIRSNSKSLGIKPDFYKDMDIHIHAPEGAVPKDGPSAGVTMTTALVSALSKKPVYKDVAMTGEITLKGKVIPIGGLKEKTMAAYKEGIKTVIIPSGNKNDLQKIDEIVKKSINFVTADNLNTVFENAIENFGSGLSGVASKRRTKKVRNT